jgi:hypothetical protein
MPFEKEALRILNGGRRENEVMILMDVRFRCYGVIDFGVAQVGVVGIPTVDV